MAPQNAAKPTHRANGDGLPGPLDSDGVGIEATHSAKSALIQIVRASGAPFALAPSPVGQIGSRNAYQRAGADDATAIH